ncbi:MAG: DUF2164 domain-containing protein [Sarcina sp.]
MKNLTLSKERNEKIIRDIQEFFLTERDEVLGELAASIILDFILETVGPELYNQGVFDSYKYMSDRVEDLLSITK